jgi:hypothetical protein
VDLSPAQVLDVLARVRTFVYLPRGLEPAGRMPVEARLLGCEVVVNEHVGVCGESWWTGDEQHAFDFVRGAPRRFWELVAELSKEKTP